MDFRRSTIGSAISLAGALFAASHIRFSRCDDPAAG